MRNLPSESSPCLVAATDLRGKTPEMFQSFAVLMAMTMQHEDVCMICACASSSTTIASERCEHGCCAPFHELLPLRRQLQRFSAVRPVHVHAICALTLLQRRRMTFPPSNWAVRRLLA